MSDGNEAIGYKLIWVKRVIEKGKKPTRLSKPYGFVLF
jgi:hypothetical protein